MFIEFSEIIIVAAAVMWTTPTVYHTDTYFLYALDFVLFGPENEMSTKDQESGLSKRVRT